MIMVHALQRPKFVSDPSPDVRRQFSCPYIEEEPGCRFVDQPSKCVFGHASSHRRDGAPSPSTTTALRDVPHYACLFHLTNKCYNSRPQDHGEGVQICRNGFHLSHDNLASLGQFESRNAQRIKDFYGEDYERECGVCLERILSKRLARNRKFALLLNCTHVFCAPCIRSWKDSQSQGSHEVSCPLCRKVSLVIYEPTFVVDAEEKAKLLVKSREEQQQQKQSRH